MWRTGKVGLVCLGVLGLLVGVLLVAQSAQAQSKCGNTAAPAKPTRIKGGESVPPLPLPATPLRRTERKRQPSPPALVGKLEYGKLVWATDAEGKKYSYLDWTTDPQDIANLLIWTNSQLGIKYKPITAKFNAFSYDPAEIPILYLTGHEGFELSDEYRKNLRWFLQDGGYLIAECCCGSKAYAESFMKEMAIIFPDRPLKPLSLDHPLFNCFYQINQVQYRDGEKSTEKKAPLVYGVNIGCRTAVMFVPYDVSCGWDGHPGPGGFGLMQNDARQLGANMITYSLANYQLGRFLSTEKVYFEKDEKTRDEFVFGQVMHSGDWDPDPGAVANLLKYVGANSTMEIQFKRANVDLKKADAFMYPFLYLTCHEDFK